MAECLNDLNLQSLWECEISEEDEKFINDQVVPLNCMVRECYLKYLKQTLLKNLNMCPDSYNIFSQHDVEKCANFLELKALRLCMVTNLYQKAMVQMVAEIKKHTKETRLYYKLEEILQKNCSCKINKCKATQTNILELKVEEQGNNFENMSCVSIKTEEKETIFVPDNCSFEKDDLCNKSVFDICSNSTKDLMTLKGNNISEMRGSNISDTIHSAHSSFDKVFDNAEEAEAVKQLDFYLNEGTETTDFGKVLLYDSGTQELIRILESDDDDDDDVENTRGNIRNNEDDKSRCIESINGSSDSSHWQLQRQLQKKKLHDCISKICCNPIAKVKMKNKFFDIFGYDSDEDDVWCSKEKIAKYKQRIAPWVVRYLVPYYRQKRIMGRPVFKYVASHITDKLVSIHHFPEEADVEKSITLFFSYHGFISKAEDVWQDWDKELHRIKYE